MSLLYLVRHGIAEDRSASGRDEDRVLTREGIDKLQRAATGFAWLEVKPDAIWVSPLRRASQTAEILRDATAPGLELTAEARLRPQAAVDDMLRQLHTTSAKSLVLVGHEPSISALASALLTGNASGAQVPFNPGSAMALGLTEITASRSARLHWFMTAEQLGQLSR